MKDIFIDTQVAILFANTKDKHLEKLISWLLYQDIENPENNAYLVISDKLRIEYFNSNKDNEKEFSITTIFHTLLGQGRLHTKKSDEIKNFQTQYFTKKVWSNLRSKRKGSDDPSHVALVMLSNRRMVLSRDNNFLYDVINFKGVKGVKVCANQCPSQLNYQ